MRVASATVGTVCSMASLARWVTWAGLLDPLLATPKAVLPVALSRLRHAALLGGLVWETAWSGGQYCGIRDPSQQEQHRFTRAALKDSEDQRVTPYSPQTHFSS